MGGSGCTSCAPRCIPRPVAGACVERVQSFKPLVEFTPSCAEFEGLTTYRHSFFPKCTERVLPFKPISNSASCAPFDGLTTYRSFFPPKCGPKMESYRPPCQFEPSCAPFDGLTMYKRDYIGVQAEKVVPIKPPSFVPSCSKMDALTTYREYFHPYCPSRTPSFKPPLDSVGFSCAKFDGNTTYRMDYFSKPIINNPRPRAPLVAFSNERFADQTTYRNSYFPFHFKSCCSSLTSVPCGDGDVCQ